MDSASGRSGKSSLDHLHFGSDLDFGPIQSFFSDRPSLHLSATEFVCREKAANHSFLGPAHRPLCTDAACLYHRKCHRLLLCGIKESSQCSIHGHSSQSEAGHDHSPALLHVIVFFAGIHWGCSDALGSIHLSHKPIFPSTKNVSNAQ